MASSDLLRIFQQAIKGKATCTAARLSYEHADDREYQRLEFDGFFVANSQPYTIQSDRIGPQGDLPEATRVTAANLLTKALIDGH